MTAGPRTVGRRIGWLIDAVLAGPAVAYLTLSRPVLGSLAVAGLVAVPTAVLRPDVLALGLVAMSAVSAVWSQAHVLTFGGAALLVVGAFLAARHGSSCAEHPPRVGWASLCAGGMILLLISSATIGRTGGFPASDVRSDLMGVVAGLVLVVAVSVVPPGPTILARTVVLTGAVAAGCALLQGSYDNGRLEGLGLGTNYLGALLAMPFAAAVGLIRSRGGAVWLGPLAVCAAALVQTHSRGALMAAAVGAGVALLGGRPMRWQLVGTAAVAAVCAGLVTLVGPLRDVLLGDRGAAELDANSDVRRQAIELAVDVAVAHPVWGIGYRAFPEFAATHPSLGVHINTHNDYLRLAAESGVVSLLLFAAVLLGGLTARGGGLTPVRAAVTAGAANLVFANTLSNLIVSGAFWICLGCLLGSRSRRHRPRHAQSGVPDAVKEKLRA